MPTQHRDRRVAEGTGGRGGAWRSAAEWHRFEQPDPHRLAGRRLVLASSAFPGAGERLAERRLRRVHLEVADSGLLARADQEPLGLVLVLEPDGDETEPS